MTKQVKQELEPIIRRLYRERDENQDRSIQEGRAQFRAELEKCNHENLSGRPPLRVCLDWPTVEGLVALGEHGEFEALKDLRNPDGNVLAERLREVLDVEPAEWEAETEGVRSLGGFAYGYVSEALSFYHEVLIPGFEKLDDTPPDEKADAATTGA